MSLSNYHGSQRRGAPAKPEFIPRDTGQRISRDSQDNVYNMEPHEHYCIQKPEAIHGDIYAELKNAYYPHKIRRSVGIDQVQSFRSCKYMFREILRGETHVTVEVDKKRKVEKLVRTNTMLVTNKSTYPLEERDGYSLHLLVTLPGARFHNLTLE